MTRDDLKRLGTIEHYPSVTILVPTHKTMPERLQDPIKIKEMAGKAIERLLEEFKKEDVLPLATSLDKLISRIDFTQLLDGLVFFINKDIAEVYILPFEVDEKINVDKHFFTRDIIKRINKTPHYWVLALSEKPTRLFNVFGNNIQEIMDPKELQDNMEGFPFKLNYDVTSDRELLAYGTGDKDIRYLTDLKLNFMNQVDKLLDNYFVADPRPLIILGTQNNRSAFEKVTKHKNFIVGQYEGDFSRIPSHEILKISDKLIDDYFHYQKKLALDLFTEAVGKLKHGFGIKEVWRLAQEGRVHILLVEEGYSVPGLVNRDNPENIVIYEKPVLGVSDDIVDCLIDSVIAKNGQVIFVPQDSLKEYEKIGAILRY